ncbi:MAG: hypothetical protein ABIA74_01865, partial [bacterium]
ILEILLGAILIVLLILMIFLFTSTEQTKNTTTITNSFNKNYYYSSPSQNYNYLSYKKTYAENYPDYDYHAYKKTTKGVFGNNIDKYIVEVKNKACEEAYFQVKFYFTDSSGRTDTEAVSYYIKPKQSREFVYKDIYSDDYKIKRWDYEVLPKTKVYNTC